MSILLLLPLSLLTASAHASNVTQVNRYATVANKPLAAQVNPLLAVQQMHFPQEVKTVGQAINSWLQYSGFTLDSSERQPASLAIVMRQTLPQIDRNLGPLTVKEGLEVLVGQTVFTVVEDPLLRQVHFKLKPIARSKHA